MAKRKKRATVRRGRSVALRKGGKVSKSGRGKVKAKRTKSSAKARVKRPNLKKVARKKVQPMNPPPSPAVETVIVDVVEEPVPGVITVTEFEGTEVRETPGE